MHKPVLPCFVAHGRCQTYEVESSIPTTAAVKRVSARKALRGELAVDYEDSGIDLLANGKFAEGLPGASKSRHSNVGIKHGAMKHFVIIQISELCSRLCLILSFFVALDDDTLGTCMNLPGTDGLKEDRAGPRCFPWGHWCPQVLFRVSIVELCCAKKVFEWNPLEVEVKKASPASSPAMRRVRRRCARRSTLARSHPLSAN